MKYTILNSLPNHYHLLVEWEGDQQELLIRYDVSQAAVCIRSYTTVGEDGREVTRYRYKPVNGLLEHFIQKELHYDRCANHEKDFSYDVYLAGLYKALADAVNEFRVSQYQISVRNKSEATNLTCGKLSALTVFVGCAMAFFESDWALLMIAIPGVVGGLISYKARHSLSRLDRLMSFVVPRPELMEPPENYEPTIAPSMT